MCGAVSVMDIFLEAYLVFLYLHDCRNSELFHSGV